jgi:hypothetical protein
MIKKMLWLPVWSVVQLLCVGIGGAGWVPSRGAVVRAEESGTVGSGTVFWNGAARMVKAAAPADVRSDDAQTVSV